MVTFFWPWIWKENMKAIHRIITNHIFQNFKSIVFNYIKILQITFLDFRKNLSNSRGMYFDSKVIYFRISFCKGNCGISHSKTDFNYNRICVTKYIYKIKFFMFKGDTPGWSKLVIGTLLSGSHSACTQYIGFYFTPQTRGRDSFC